MGFENPKSFYLFQRFQYEIKCFLRHERQFSFLTFFTKTWHHQIKPNRCATAHAVYLNLLHSAWEHAVCVLIYSFHCCPLLDVTQSLISNIFNNLFPGENNTVFPWEIGESQRGNYISRW